MSPAHLVKKGKYFQNEAHGLNFSFLTCKEIDSDYNLHLTKCQPDPK